MLSQVNTYYTSLRKTTICCCFCLVMILLDATPPPKENDFKKFHFEEPVPEMPVACFWLKITV